MKTLYVRNIRSVNENLAILQKRIKVGIAISGNSVTLTGKEENIYDAEKVFEALDAGFSVDTALLLIDPDYLFDTMNVKDFTRRKKLDEVRARIIGTGGKTKKLMEKLSDSFIKLKENTVYIIGLAEDMRDTKTAIEKLIRGSAQGKVYGFLERSRTQHKYDDVIVNDKTKSGEDKNKVVDNKNTATDNSLVVKKNSSFKKKKKFKVKKKIDNYVYDDKNDDIDDDFDDDIDDFSNSEEKIVIKPLKRKTSKVISSDELTKGIKNLQDPDDEGLELED